MSIIDDIEELRQRLGNSRVVNTRPSLAEVLPQSPLELLFNPRGAGRFLSGFGSIASQGLEDTDRLSRYLNDPVRGIVADALAATSLRRAVTGKKQVPFQDYLSGKRYREEIAPRNPLGGLGTAAIDMIFAAENLLPIGTASKTASSIKQETTRLAPIAEQYLTSLNPQAARSLVQKELITTLSKIPESPQNMLVDYARTLDDAMTEVSSPLKGIGKPAGIPVAGAVREGARTPIPEWPGSRDKANLVEAKAWEALEDKMSQIEDPLRQFNAIRAKYHVQNEVIHRWNREAAGAAQTVARDEQDDIFANRHGNVMRAIEALSRLVDQLEMTPVRPVREGVIVAGMRIIDQTNRFIRGEWSKSGQLNRPGLIQDFNEHIKRMREKFGLTHEDAIYEPGYYMRADPIYQARNTEIYKALDTAHQRLLKNYFPDGEYDDVAEAINNYPFRDQFERLFTEVRNQAIDLPRFYGQISAKSAEFLRRHEPTIIGQYNLVVRDTNKIQRIIDRVTLQRPESADIIADVLMPKLDAQGKPIAKTTSTMDELIEALRPYAQDPDLDILQNTVTKWERAGYRLLDDDPLKVIQGRLIEKHAAVLGVKAPEGWGASAHYLLRLYKEQATLAVDFPVQNALGIVFISGLHGYDMLNMTKKLGTALVAGVQGKPHMPVEFMELLAAIGWQGPPAGLVGGFVTEALAPDMMSIIQRKVPAGRSAMRQLPLGVGKVMGPVQEFWKDRIHTSLEDAGRATVWFTEMSDGISKAAPKFLDELQVFLNKPAPAVTGRAGLFPTSTPVLQRIDPADVQKLVDGFRARSGQFSVDELRLQLNNAGAPVESVQPFLQRWADELRRISDYGVKRAQDVNLDYAKTDIIEDKLQWLSPFIKFPKRMLPKLTSILLQNPRYLMAINRYIQVSEDETQDLPLRFKGQVSLGIPGNIIHWAVTGRPGKTFINPLSMLLPFSGAITSASAGFVGDEGQRSGGYEQILDTASKFGLSTGAGGTIGQWLAYLAAGHPSTPVPRMLRHSQMLEDITRAVTGVPMSPERLLSQGLGAGYSALRGEGAMPGTVDFHDYNVRKRIMEMSAEAGKPGSQEYKDAIGDPLSPIYQQADADVRRSAGLRSIINSLIPSYASYLSDTESTIRKSEATLPKPERDKNGNLVNRQQAIEQWLQATDDPLTAVYRKPLPPVNVDMIWNAMLEYYPEDASGRAKWKRIHPAFRVQVLGDYVKWLRAQGKSMPGTRDDVKEYIRIKERR